MPTRTMLPPNLTRHFYETRRAFLQSAGQDSTPWFQLSPVERAVVESEMEIFRQSIRRAEEEQDLLATLDVTRTAPVDEPAAEETPEPATAAQASKPCDCPGCSAVAAILKLIRAPAERLETTLGWEADGSGKGAPAVAFRILPLGTKSLDTPLSNEEKARVEKAAREAIDRWRAQGKPLDGVTAVGEPTGSWSFGTQPISLDALFREPSPFAGIRRDFWQKASPGADKA
ncbi:hypothetical protein [Streptomyces sp. NPDC059850]|uniref:hypothetical protein n=1 Tax=Streptomyces sp. NPDC059850 TaxID=3346970 RepID=UPI003654F90E